MSRPKITLKSTLAFGPAHLMFLLQISIFFTIAFKFCYTNDYSHHIVMRVTASSQPGQEGSSVAASQLKNYVHNIVVKTLKIYLHNKVCTYK